MKNYLLSKKPAIREVVKHVIISVYCTAAIASLVFGLVFTAFQLAGKI